MLKSPCWAYRLSRLKEKGPDGQVQTDIDGQPFLFSMQGTSELRPGERIILVSRHEEHQYLEKLAVAGGEGADLLARAKRRASSRLALDKSTVESALSFQGQHPIRLDQSPSCKTVPFIKEQRYQPCPMIILPDLNKQQRRAVKARFKFREN